MATEYDKLFAAINTADVTEIERFVETGLDINNPGGGGTTPMTTTHSKLSSDGDKPAVAHQAVGTRRTLHFQSLDEVASDAERLVSSPGLAMLGNWPLDQLLTHLATAINSSIDGISVRAPWYARLVGRLVKRRILATGMRPGFKLPKKVEADFFPTAESPQQALALLRAAIARTHAARMTSRHPILGQLTHDEWIQLHLRHAELHLSFAVPIC